MTDRTPEQMAFLSEALDRAEAAAATMRPDVIKHAVADGIKTALSDPQMWAAAMRAMQHHAQTEAGGWLFGGLKAVISRAAWVVVIGMGIYLIGGWSALAAFFKTGGHP